MLYQGPLQLGLNPWGQLAAQRAEKRATFPASRDLPSGPDASPSATAPKRSFLPGQSKGQQKVEAENTDAAPLPMATEVLKPQVTPPPAYSPTLPPQASGSEPPPVLGDADGLRARSQQLSGPEQRAPLPGSAANASRDVSASASRRAETGAAADGTQQNSLRSPLEGAYMVRQREEGGPSGSGAADREQRSIEPGAASRALQADRLPHGGRL